MLLKDGVKYEAWTPPSEDEFEQMVKEHWRDIFGEQAECFEKQKLESKLGIGSVPDGFAVIFGDSPCWHIVEVELSKHDVHRHIVEQHSRFIMGITTETRNKLVKAIYNEINNDDTRRQKLKKAVEPNELHSFLHEVISKPPILTIIIEKPRQELKETLRALSRDVVSDIKVVEFQTFTREGVGLGVHAHLFEPLYKPTISGPQQPPSPVAPTTGAFEIMLQRSYIGQYYLQIPVARKALFPSSKTTLELETDIGAIEVGFGTEPSYGLWLSKGLARWFKAHPELKAGDKVTIEVVEPMKRYRLRKL